MKKIILLVLLSLSSLNVFAQDFACAEGMNNFEAKATQLEEDGKLKFDSMLEKMSVKNNWSQEKQMEVSLGFLSDKEYLALTTKKLDLMSRMIDLMPKQDCAKLNDLFTEILNIQKLEWQRAVESIESAS